MPTYIAKPPSPIWQPHRAPAGCRLYLPLSAGAGRTVRDLSGRAGVNGTLVGSPVWQTGLYGPQLGGFTTANYVALDAPASIVPVVYPFWAAVMAQNTATTSDSVPFCLSDTSSASSYLLFSYNSGGVAGKLVGSGSAGASYTLTWTSGGAITDGNMHVAMIVSWGSTNHRLYWDGIEVASTTGPLTIPGTWKFATVGMLRRNTVGNAFPGSVAIAAAGSGAVPDPMALAQDWLSGRFASVRPVGRDWLSGALTPLSSVVPLAAHLNHRRRVG